MRAAFAAFALDYQVTGRFGDSLDRLKHRLSDPVGDRVVEGLRVAREVGGGELGRLLRNLSGYLRDDLRTRSELEARQAWAVNGARLAVAAPWVVLLLMSAQTEIITRYRSPTGVVILLVGAGVCLVAYRLMMRIGRLPVEAPDPLVTPTMWGALAGATAGLGVVLVLARVAAIRRPQLSVRVLPYLRDLRPASDGTYVGSTAVVLGGRRCVRPGARWPRGRGREGARRLGIGPASAGAGRSRPHRARLPGRAGGLGSGRLRRGRGAGACSARCRAAPTRCCSCWRA